MKAERYFDDVDTLLDEVTYLYDLDGNRTQRTSSAGVEDYIYESGSRLTQVLLDGVETQRFEYDNNGRVTRIVRDGLDQRLTWDALDRLTRIEDQNFVEEPVEFTYDGQGRRVSADRGSSLQRYVVGPTGNQSLESPHLVHNGAFLTGELVYGGEHALWRYQGDGTLQTRVYLRDAMGSVIGLMDENGQLIESFDYDAFGNVRSAGGEALPEVSFGGDSRFQGMWKDAGTGLYYVRARYYDARTGRFLSRDPAEGQLERPESLYPYVFANGNPYVFRDPTGLFSLTEFMTGLYIRTQNAAAAIGSAASAAAIRFKEQIRAGFIAGRNLVGSFKFAARQGASALKQASDAAFAAANRVQVWTPKNIHLPGGPTTKSKFLASDFGQVRALVQEALRSPNAHFVPNAQIPQSVKIVVDMGRIVGTQGERYVRVIVKAGSNPRVVNAFPSKGSGL